jgi:hypothetical protein
MLFIFLGVLLLFVVQCRTFFTERLRPDGNGFAKGQ